MPATTAPIVGAHRTLLGGVRSAFDTLAAALSIWYSAFRRSQIALIGILIATASVLPDDQPLVIHAGINMHVPDLLLIGSLALIVVRSVVARRRILRTPLDLPLLVFFAVTFTSTAIAVLRSTTDLQQAVAAARIFSYYATFFVVTNLVAQPIRIRYLVNCILAIGTMVAAAMVAQYLLGDSAVLLPGVSGLNTRGTVFESVNRVAPPGLSLVVVSFVTSCCTLVLERSNTKSVFRFMQCGLLGAAMLVTFLRSYWAAIFLVMLILVFLVRDRDRRRAFRWSIAAVCSAAVLLLMLLYRSGPTASHLLDASWDRLSTLGSKQTFEGGDGSVDYRLIENQYAFSAIESSPVIGRGLGATFRPLDPRLDWRDANGVYHDLRWHIHNGYLWILLQSGILGLAALAWLSVVFVARSVTRWRTIADAHLRAIVLGFALAYVAVAIAAGANSSFMQWNWTPVIGIMMGVNEVILRTACSPSTAQ